MHGISRYIEDLITSRRPRRFRVGEDDAAIARTAITLRAARPGSGEPAEEFVTALHKKLAAELDPPAARRAVGGRRMFLHAATAVGAAAVGAAAGAGVDHVLTSRTPPGPSPASAGTLTPSRGTWLTVAAGADLPVRCGTPVHRRRGHRLHRAAPRPAACRIRHLHPPGLQAGPGRPPRPAGLPLSRRDVRARRRGPRP